MQPSIFILLAIYQLQHHLRASPIHEELNWEGQKPNPEEGEYFQGDISWHPPTSSYSTKQALFDTSYRWADATLIYTINDNFDSNQVETIKEAMKQISKQTCIKFREKTQQDKNFVQFFHPLTGCNSAIGMKGGEQELNLADPCFTSLGSNKPWGRPAHEIMHALGLQHEQARTDRDEFVKIQWDNIGRDKQHDFKKYGKDEITSFGLPYDYDSIMHYARTSFAIDRSKDTITPKKRDANIGQRGHLSQGDIEKLNSMYCQ